MILPTYARRAAERISRGIVIKRHLPARFGRQPVFVSPDAMLKLWKPRSLDQAGHELFAWAAEFVVPGDVVWDIGANVGLFSFAAAAQAGPQGHVIAIEPDSWLVGLLRRSAGEHIAHRARVDVIPLAVAERFGIERFSVAQRGRASNFLADHVGSSQSGGSRRIDLVPAAPLDWLVLSLPPPTVLKIDVEGSEVDVLRGGEKLLKEKPPLILIEVSETNAAAVESILVRHGYALYDLDEPGRRTLRQHPAFNTLALPSAQKPTCTISPKETSCTFSG